MIPLNEVLSNAPIDVLCVDETKLDPSCPDHHFKIEGCHFPSFRRDRNLKGGGKLVYLREGFIEKRIPKLETERRKLLALKSLLLRKISAFYLFTVLQTSRKLSFFRKFQ